MNPGSLRRSGFSLLSVKLVDLLLRGGDVLLLLGLLIGELLLKLLDLLNGLSLLIGNFAVVEQTVEHIAQVIDARQNLKQAQTAGFVLAGEHRSRAWPDHRRSPAAFA